LHITIFDPLKRHGVHGSDDDGMNPYHCAPS
jgi:hypothetical protein